MRRFVITTIPAGDVIGTARGSDPVEACRVVEKRLGGDGSHDFRLADRAEVEEGGGYVAHCIPEGINIAPLQQNQANYRAWLRANERQPSWVRRVPALLN